MRPAVDLVLAAHGGVATRSQLLRAVRRSELDDEVRRGRLVAVFPRTYARPWDADLLHVRERAALASTGPSSALSHLSALRRWGLDVRPVGGAADSVHVTVPYRRHPFSAAEGLLVHRTRLATRVVDLSGVRTVACDVALVTSWSRLDVRDRRGPAIAAVRNGLVTPDDLRAELARRPGLPGGREQRDLVDLLAGGCESELELWGHAEVFTGPGLDHGVRQFRLDTAIGRLRLDIGFVEERLAVELDGAAFHGSRERRERDLRRDAAVGALGWMTLRFSHERLHHDVAGCRRDTLATLAARQRPGAAARGA